MQPLSQGSRIQHSATYHLAASPAVVFPLLCPEREREWVPGWEYTMVYSESGLAEAGCVFTAHAAVWVVSRYEPAAGRIEYVRYYAERAVVQLAFDLQAVAGEATAMTLTVTITGLPGQDEAVAQLASINESLSLLFTRALPYYLTTGACLPV